MPRVSASTGASRKPAASRALLPWQKITSSPTPAPTLSTATIVFTPGRNRDGSFSSTSCGRNRTSLRPLMLASFLVATTEPSTRAKNTNVISNQQVSNQWDAQRGSVTEHRPTDYWFTGSFLLRQHHVHVG